MDSHKKTFFQRLATTALGAVTGAGTYTWFALEFCYSMKEWRWKHFGIATAIGATVGLLLPTRLIQYIEKALGDEPEKMKKSTKETAAYSIYSEPTSTKFRDKLSVEQMQNDQSLMR